MYSPCANDNLNNSRNKNVNHEATKRRCGRIADSNFCLGQCRKGDGSRGGTIFDVEFAQDVFDVLADRPGACAKDHADLIVRFTLCDPSQNLRFACGETQ